MRLRQQMLTRNDCYQEGRTIRPLGVMIHSTGANNPRVSRYVPGNDEMGINSAGTHWNQPGLDVCVHAFIGRFADGDVGVVQTLPWNRRGWHCGRGKLGSGNDTHISFEICEDALTDASYFSAVYQEAVELTTHLCKVYGLDPQADGVVICHAEGHRLGIASGHGDVLQWWPKHGVTMDDFRRTVENHMKGENDVTQEQFNAMMEEYLRQRRTQEPAGWSRTAREWAEASGLVAGDGAGEKGYRAFATREETVQMLYRLSKCEEKSSEQ